MRSVLMILALVLGPMFSAPAAAEARRGGIEATIDAQIEAFRAGDLDRAFGYASPTIRGIFRTPDNFGRMVQRGYPMVWRPAELRYLDLREIGGRLWQRVMITDHAGTVHLLDYEMIELDGAWRINGVRLLDSAAANA